MKLQRTAPARPALVSAILLLCTPVLGIVVRFGLTGLPWFLRKYGGSVLWAAMVYWIISTLLRRTAPWIAALLSECAAVAVEFLKRVHTPALEHFRATLAGVLLLGKEFAYADIVAYTVAIAMAATLDARLRSQTGESKHSKGHACA